MKVETIQTYRTANCDFLAIKNDTFNQTVQFTDDQNQPVNLSVYDSARMQLKENENTDSLLEFSSTGLTHNINLSGSTIGIITISSTVPLDIPAYSYRYDLQFSNGSVFETIAKGKFKVIQDITG
jgi:hypothetical protein